MTSIAKLVETLREGGMVIIMDSPERENEADIVMAAEKVTPWHINFMITHAKGLICTPMSGEHCDRLGLPLQPRRNCSPCTPKFTISIEAAEGITTGVSAADRAHTIQLAADPSTPSDAIATPGHIFPIRSADGGVLERPGHTEASVELVTMAGLSPCSIVCEITSPDGSMSRLPDVQTFAKEHNLPIGFIRDLIELRKKA